MKIKDVRNWWSTNMNGLDLINLITHFAQSNKAEGKAPKTVSWYSDMLIDFVNYLKFVGVDDLGTYDGFDLDAVEALNSGPYVPIPSTILLLGSGFVGFIGLRRRLERSVGC